MQRQPYVAREKILRRSRKILWQLLEPRICKVARAEPTQLASLMHSYLVVVSTSCGRLSLVGVQHSLWLREYDHLVVCEQRACAGVEHLVGMRYASAHAHKALAGVLCVQRTGQGGHDFTLVADDDTVFDVPALDAALIQKLMGAAPASLPVLLGARVDMQLNGSTSPSCHSHFHGRACHRATWNATMPPWAFTQHFQGKAVGFIQRGPWAVGWPYGGRGIILSRAAADLLAPIGAECLRCLTCPLYGASAAHRANAKEANAASAVAFEARLGFGACAQSPYDAGSGKCAGAFDSTWGQRRNSLIVASIRCAVQIRTWRWECALGVPVMRRRCCRGIGRRTLISTGTTRRLSKWRLSHSWRRCRGRAGVERSKQRKGGVSSERRSHVAQAGVRPDADCECSMAGAWYEAGTRAPARGDLRHIYLRRRSEGRKRHIVDSKAAARRTAHAAEQTRRSETDKTNIAQVLALFYVPCDGVSFHFMPPLHIRICTTVA